MRRARRRVSMPYRKLQVSYDAADEPARRLPDLSTASFGASEEHEESDGCVTWTEVEKEPFATFTFCYRPLGASRWSECRGGLTVV